MKSGFIYILLDPRTNLVRYVGQTISSKARFRKHIYESKRKKNT